jgi:hypothetical protein
MGDHDTPSTCLSAREHVDHVRDAILHYAGCLKEKERGPYYDKLPEHKKKRIRLETERVRNLRALIEEQEKDKPDGITQNFKQSLQMWRNEKRKKKKHMKFGASSTDGPKPTVERPCKENGFNMDAYAIFYNNSEPANDEHCLDKFPNQKISIQKLLYPTPEEEEHNPLMRECRKDEIRYIHLPGNNMEWVEVV